MAEPVIEVEGLTVVLGGRAVVREVSFQLGRGQFLAVLGQNGAGKSCLLRAMTGALPHAEGRVRLLGLDVSAVSAKVLARRVAVLRQETNLEFDFSVVELIEMGRSPHLGLWTGFGPSDREAIALAVERTAVGSLLERRFLALSGGERQRVLLARALAQSPEILLLDEPTAHLDVRHQLEIIETIAGLGLTVVAVLHDPALALRFADQALLLGEGRLSAVGPAPEVLSADRLGALFGVQVEPAQTASGQVVFGFQAQRAIKE
ncbi:MAG: ABC transporter ATP-binding protein [Myxococcota bacterium]